MNDGAASRDAYRRGGEHAPYGERADPGWDRNAEVRGSEDSRGRPGSGYRQDPQRRRLVEQEERRLSTYRRQLDQRRDRQREYEQALRDQNRGEQHRIYQDYLERSRRRQQEFHWERHDFRSDPYFNARPQWRYRFRDRYYETNRYGADLLRQAVRYGYQEGFHAGRADRRDRWRSSYADSYAYQDADYGYPGYYLDQGAYQHYFREGFRRGYYDGYRRRHRYGRETGGDVTILEAVLVGILVLQALD